MTPGEKPAVSSSTCAWNSSPVIGEPVFPVETNRCSLRHRLLRLLCHRGGSNGAEGNRSKGHATQLSTGINGSRLQRCRLQTFPKSANLPFTSAARAGCTNTGAASFIRKGCRSGSGSSVTRMNSTRSKSTRASIAFRSRETFDGWRDKAPKGFRYAVKVNRFITHLKKLVAVEDALGEFVALARKLGPALGPLLYQLPPSLKLDLDRLETFLKLIPRDLSNVFEFRNKSWYVPELYTLLDRYGASFCAHDMPGSKTERIAVGPIAYIRFHGGEGKIRAAIRTKGCSAGPTGSWSSHVRAAASGAISTMTSTDTPFTTRRRSSRWADR